MSPSSSEYYMLHVLNIDFFLSEIARLPIVLEMARQSSRNTR